MRPGTHVGINAVFLEPGMGGLETYVRELIPELLSVAPAMRISIFANQGGAESLAVESWATDVSIVTHPLIGRRPARALSELALLAPLARRHGVELLHSVGMTAPLATRPVGVVQVSDVIWLTHPDPADRLTAAVWRAIVPPVARRARRVITLSEASRRELVARLRIPVERIDVVPLGPGSEPEPEVTSEPELRERLGLGAGPVILAVAAKRRHKNLEALVEALPEVHRAVPDAQLVMPGKPTPYEQRLRERAEELGVGSSVVLPPFVSKADLEGLYAAAACFVLPSFVEGFGLPILEAMRRGVPVACAAASAPAEVAGKAALLFDPYAPGDLAAAVTSLLTDRQRAAELARLGRRRAESFTWRTTADRTLESWSRALAEV